MKRKGKISTQGVVIRCLLLLGFLVMEFPGVLLFKDMATPRIFGLPFAYGIMIIGWIYMCVISAIYTLDIHKRYFDKNASDKKLITITKWVLLIVSAITYLVIITSPTMIMKTGLLGLSGTAQLLVPTLGAFFWKRSNAQGAIAGLTIGVFLLLLLSSVCHMDVSFAGSIGLAFNTVLFIVIGRSPIGGRSGSSLSRCRPQATERCSRCAPGAAPRSAAFPSAPEGIVRPRQPPGRRAVPKGPPWRRRRRATAWRGPPLGPPSVFPRSPSPRARSRSGRPGS